VFLFILGACIGGVTYSLSFLPSGRLKRVKYRRLKDIPGSKTLFIALAWAGVATLTAPLSAVAFRMNPNLIATFLTAGALVLIRTATFDLRDIQGDLIVGRETIPIVLGKKRTQHLLVLLITVIGASFVVLPILGVLPYLSFGLLVSVLYMAYCLFWVFRQEFMSSAHLEFLVDGSFVLAAFISIVWRASGLPL